MGEPRGSESRGRPGRAGARAGDWGWRGAARAPWASGAGRRATVPSCAVPAAALAACQSLCAYRHVSRLSPVGVCLSTLGHCVQLAAAWPVCGCGVCGCVTGDASATGPGAAGTRPASDPSCLTALWDMEMGGGLGSHLISGLRVMCCLGSWDGKVRRKGFSFPSPEGFRRLQVDGVSFVGGGNKRPSKPFYI